MQYSLTHIQLTAIFYDSSALQLANDVHSVVIWGGRLCPMLLLHRILSTNLFCV